MLQALIKYGKDKNGTYNVKKTFKFIDNSLNGNNILHIGVWLHSQRENKIKGNLRSDREAILQVRFLPFTTALFLGLWAIPLHCPFITYLFFIYLFVIYLLLVILTNLLFFFCWTTIKFLFKSKFH